MTSRRRTSKILTVMLVSAFALPLLGGCTLLPAEWRTWLMGPADGEEQYFYYDYPEQVEAGTAPVEQQKRDWTQQSWMNGAPVIQRAPVQEEKLSPPPRQAVPMGQKRAVFRGDPEQRISKLELEVSTLRQEINAMLPALRALVEARGGYLPEPRQQVSPQPQIPYQEPPQAMGMQSAQPQALTPWPQAENASPQAFAPQAPVYDSYAQNIRFGEHGNKTRIVIDLERPTAYTYELSNEQGYLAIILPEAGWRGPVRGTLNKSPLFSGYTVQQVPGKGSRLVLQLRKPVSVLFADHLDPNNTYRSHRIFLDVAGQ